MSHVTPLRQDQLETELGKLPKWTVTENKLHAEFRFANFIEAFAFITKVALLAEAAQHHPTWTNTYNVVSIDLVTHDANNQISRRDIDLAHQINDVAL